jgi:hypothetical protein
MFVTDGDRLLTEAWRRDVYYARVVGAYSQLFKFDTNGAETQLTHDNANVTNVRDSDDEVQWQSDVDAGVRRALVYEKSSFDPRYSHETSSRYGGTHFCKTHDWLTSYIN